MRKAPESGLKHGCENLKQRKFQFLCCETPQDKQDCCCPADKLFVWSCLFFPHIYLECFTGCGSWFRPADTFPAEPVNAAPLQHCSTCLGCKYPSSLHCIMVPPLSSCRSSMFNHQQCDYPIIRVTIPKQPKQSKTHGIIIIMIIIDNLVVS